jgi:hypothetical protein
MTKGQAFEEVNKYRQSFFNEVITQAEQVGFCSYSSSYKDDQLKESTKAVEDRHYSLDDPALLAIRVKKLQKAGKALRRFVDRRKVLCQKGAMWRPFVIFSFDEAHELTESRKNEDWSTYLVLRNCLTRLLRFPFFFLFLSTSGKFRNFSPETLRDPSTRIANGGSLVLPPITETGFDQLAFTAIEGRTTLEEVVTDNWISHLGRPL